VIEEFKGETWRDFQARYQGTYGWYQKASGQKLLVTLVEVDEHACKFVDADGGIFTALSDKGNNFQFIPVKRGIYRTHHGLVYCRRIPAKQYKRGIASGNTYIAALGGRQIKLDFKIIEEMFGEHDQQEVEKFKSGERQNVVFNNAFAIAMDRVWLYDNIIGVQGVRRLSLTHQLFKQEMEDIVRVHQLNLEIV
jgi:predicted CopG family antitoxin